MRRIECSCSSSCSCSWLHLGSVPDVTTIRRLGHLDSRSLGCYDKFGRTTLHPGGAGQVFQTLDDDYNYYQDQVFVPTRPVNERLISNILFDQPSCDPK